jgi:hypothetical protein
MPLGRPRIDQVEQKAKAIAAGRQLFIDNGYGGTVLTA